MRVATFTLPIAAIAAIAVVFAILTSASRASAEGRDAACAEALFLKGKELLASGSVDEACSLFSESLRIDPATGTLMNLADCEERQGKFASAWQRERGNPHDERTVLPRGLRAASVCLVVIVAVRGGRARERAPRPLGEASAPLSPRVARRE